MILFSQNSTVYEAVQAKIPLLVWKWESFIEDSAIARKIEEMNIGRSLSYHDLESGSWIRELDNMSHYRQSFDNLPDKYSHNGSEDIISSLREFIS